MEAGCRMRRVIGALIDAEPLNWRATRADLED